MTYNIFEVAGSDSRQVRRLGEKAKETGLTLGNHRARAESRPATGEAKREIRQRIPGFIPGR